jgi:two-component system OmpR family sensor kinase
LITPSEIGSVLDNLLANALRASPPGTACRIELTADENYARLAVHDAGPGIPLDLRERIFDRFVRGEESRNRATGGFGIGLSLCRRIVEGRGGRIWVEPTEAGARFEVELPAEDPPLSPPGERGRG